jgi:hypothetical protein
MSTKTISFIVTEDISKWLNQQAVERDRSVSSIIRMLINENRQLNQATIVKHKNKADRIPYTKIVEAYHYLLPELRACKSITPARKTAIRSRWNENSLPTIEHWQKYFRYVSESDFLVGKADAGNRAKPFKADLEWLCKEANYTKVFEGKYHE